MRRNILILTITSVFAVYGEQSVEQGKVIRGASQPDIGDVTVSKLENGDTAVKFSGKDAGSDRGFLEKKEEMETVKRLKQELPYRGNPDIRMGTFGQQAKLCDWVIIGKVSHVEKGGGKDYPITLTLGVETNLFGALPQDCVTLRLMKWRFDAKDADLAAKVSQEYRIGDKFLVFLIRGRVPVLLDIMTFMFNKPTHKKEFGDQPTLLYDSLGVIGLKGGSAEQEVLTAADGYLTCLRREKRDVEKYYQLLTRLANSPVERIMDDAKTDLVNLFSIPSIAEKAFSDEAVDVGVRRYAKFALDVQKRKDKDAH